jgi:hypothetical protein
MDIYDTRSRAARALVPNGTSIQQLLFRYSVGMHFGRGLSIGEALARGQDEARATYAEFVPAYRAELLALDKRFAAYVVTRDRPSS